MPYDQFWSFKPQQQQQPRRDPYAVADYSNPLFQGGGGMPQSMNDLVYGMTAGNMLGGMNTMANLGNSVGRQFDIANFMGSQNRQAQYAPLYNYQAAVDTNRSNERMQQNALQSKENTLGSILPHLIAALGGIGNGGMGGFQTNYGAGASYGSQAQPTNTKAYQGGMTNPLLAILSRMGAPA